MIPVIRASLARRLFNEGRHVKEIANVLNVTQAAVTQYVKQRRGGAAKYAAETNRLIQPLAEKAVKLIENGAGKIESIELLETARQLMIMNEGRLVVQEMGDAVRSEKNETLELLRSRLRLELRAAEQYLELSNGVQDDQTKLLLRMIASDSIRHGDVVSQVISWLEADTKGVYQVPSVALLRKMLSLEDSASEVSLEKSVSVGHPVARLLLEWIDLDEAKHGRIVGRMLKLGAVGQTRID